MSVVCVDVVHQGSGIRGRLTWKGRHVERKEQPKAGSCRSGERVSHLVLLPVVVPDVECESVYAFG